MLSVPIFETVQAQGNAFKSANFDFAVVTGKFRKSEIMIQ